MKTNKLLGKIAENGYSRSRFADAIDMDKPVFYKRMRDESFRIGEVVEMAKVLNLSNDDIIEIFLT